MLALRKLLRLSAREWLWLAEAAGWLWVMRLGLWLLPFHQLQRVAAWCARPGVFVGRRFTSGESAVGGRQSAVALSAANYQAPAIIEHSAWAVAVASRAVPAATCLAQALAAQVLLGRRGWAAQLRIGVARGAQGTIEAHAWLEHAGQIVIGGPRTYVAGYTVLPTRARERA